MQMCSWGLGRAFLMPDLTTRSKHTQLPPALLPKLVQLLRERTWKPASAGLSSPVRVGGSVEPQQQLMVRMGGAMGRRGTHAWRPCAYCCWNTFHAGQSPERHLHADIRALLCTLSTVLCARPAAHHDDSGEGGA